jgi:hypothetical protein
MTTETIHPTYATCVLDYARLERITTVEKPYRGSTNRYPIEDRKYSHKCFYEEVLAGEKVYRIAYGHDYVSDPITKEQYEAVPKDSRHKQRVWEVNPDNYDGNKYIHSRREVGFVGIVYPDRSFEFTAKNEYYGVGQGIKIHINGGWFPSNMYIRSSKKHGGVVISRRSFTSHVTDELIHPVFKGLRVYTDTLDVHEKCQYKTVGYKTNTKAIREAMEVYEKSFKVADVMFRAMNIMDVLDMGLELHTEDKSSYYTSIVKADRTMQLASTLIDDPIDSILRVAWAHNVNGIKSSARTKNHSFYANQDWNKVVNLKTLSDNVKKKFREALCRHNPSKLLKLTKYEAGKKYPASIWGYEVELTGITRAQYK